MTTHKNAHKAPPSLLKEFTIPFVVMVFSFGLGIFLYNKIGFLGAFFIPLIMSLLLVIILILHFGSNSKWLDEDLGGKLWATFMVGLFIGIFVAFVVGSLSHTKVSTAQPAPSYYEGIVQGISIEPQNSYVQFTTGITLYGNVSHISNLSIDSVCKLLLNENNQNYFVNGTCTR